MKKRAFLALALAFCLLFTTAGTAIAAESSGSAQAALGAGNAEVSVLLDDTWLELGELEFLAGRYYAPATKLLSAFGASGEIDMEGGLITAERGDVTLALPFDEATVRVVRDGTAAERPVDAMPLVRGEDVYLSIRVVAEALGMRVGWHGESKTIVLFDVETFLDSFDEGFTVVNRILELNGEIARTAYRTTGDFEMELSMPSELPTPITISAACDLLSDAEGASGSMTMKMNMEDLIKQISDIDDISADDLSMVAALAKGMEMDLILDMRTWDYYIQAPLLSEMMGEEKDAWLHMALFGESYGELLGELLPDGNYPSTIRGIFEPLMTEENPYIDEYIVWSSARDALKRWFSDEAFKISGTEAKPTYTYSFDIKELFAEYGELLGIEEVPGLACTVDYSIAIKGEKSYSQTFDVLLTYEDGEAPLHISFVIDSKVDVPGKGNVTMTLHAYDDTMEFKLDMKANVDQRETTETPLRKPPADAEIVPLSGVMPVPVPMY
ncbi:copper amine oxidase N-terminal domain-containing protein [Oscillospiraceae bacterium OttesenSCG-928-G22]|nr:copper amine oxidase N-terminal domain-containing protein [Oscillospiraceae bacterium OttesenSCG-928-G22]